MVVVDDRGATAELCGATWETESCQLRNGRHDASWEPLSDPNSSLLSMPLSMQIKADPMLVLLNQDAYVWTKSGIGAGCATEK